MKKVLTLSKVFLSLWIVYNIFTMLVMPNVGSYFGRISSRFITPYANTIGLNASWNFFSPDPAHTMYLHYTVHFENDQREEIQEPIEGFFPSEKNKNAFNPTRKRDLYAMRFMVIDPKRLRLLLGPWLCRKYEKASDVEMKMVVETVPLLDSVAYQERALIQDLSQELQVLQEDHRCHDSHDEESL